VAVNGGLGVIRRIAVVGLVLVAALYAGDYAVVRLRGANAFGSVPVRSYLAVRQKNGKPEYYFLDPQNQACVRSLFPHLGYPPCWYVRRHARQRIEM
jgi:hypothetical protein